MKDLSAWLVYHNDSVLDKKFTYAGGYQAFKNAMKTAKQNGHDPKRLRLMKGTLANKGGTLWELIRETEKQILP